MPKTKWIYFLLTILGSEASALDTVLNCVLKNTNQGLRLTQLEMNDVPSASSLRPNTQFKGKILLDYDQEEVTKSFAPGLLKPKFTDKAFRVLYLHKLNELVRRRALSMQNCRSLLDVAGPQEPWSKTPVTGIREELLVHLFKVLGDVGAQVTLIFDRSSGRVIMNQESNNGVVKQLASGLNTDDTIHEFFTKSMINRTGDLKIFRKKAGVCPEAKEN